MCIYFVTAKRNEDCIKGDRWKIFDNRSVAQPVFGVMEQGSKADFKYDVPTSVECLKCRMSSLTYEKKKRETV